jgi:hypothetical protein
VQHLSRVQQFKVSLWLPPDESVLPDVVAVTNNDRLALAA